MYLYLRENSKFVKYFVDIIGRSFRKYLFFFNYFKGILMSTMTKRNIHKVPKVLVLGLDNAGKSLCINLLMNGKIRVQPPTRQPIESRVLLNRGKK